MASVSVAVTVEGWPLERVLQERLWSRSTYATATVATVTDAGFRLVLTHRPPHYDVILSAATPEHASRLLAVFGVVQPNPYRRRTR